MTDQTLARVAGEHFTGNQYRKKHECKFTCQIEPASVGYSYSQDVRIFLCFREFTLTSFFIAWKLCDRSDLCTSTYGLAIANERRYVEGRFVGDEERDRRIAVRNPSMYSVRI